MMDELVRKKWEAREKELRVDLKMFEGDWIKRTGHKPGRNDIKQNPAIAQKYKKYNQARDILDGKIEPPREATKARKRRSSDANEQTPSKRSRPVQTPSKPNNHSTDLLDGFETPAIRRLFSPVIPTSIGPTPQKDGRVLGLFDLLPKNDENTPSRPKHAEPTDAKSTVDATPSKRKHEVEPSAVKLGRTPMSAGKRAMLDTFMTPLKNRSGNAQDARTPNTVSKLQFSTPAFLKRAPLPPVDENGKYVSPAPLRLPRKPIVRGLSSVVASLRKMEEEKLDEDLEALYDMENDTGPSQPTKAKELKASRAQENLLVPDSQGPQLLGGFDDEGLYDSEPEEQTGRDGLPLRVYQKKGQKRTTRKVNIKPIRVKRPQHSMKELSDDEEDDVVPETQHDAAKFGEEPPLDLENSGSEFDGSGDDRGSPVKKAKSMKKAPAKKESEKKEGVVKKIKKISATANQNFKRLKLKNHGAKGGPGFGSRFRRRR